MRADVNQSFIPSYSDSFGNSHHYVDSNEQFGICPISRKLVKKYGYDLADTLNNDSKDTNGINLIENGKTEEIPILTKGNNNAQKYAGDDIVCVHTLN